MARLFSTRIDLPPERREQLIALLNQHLAESFDLMSQVKQAHWNVKGPQFFPLHELFDTLAETLEDHNDLIAERATALGGLAIGTVRRAAAVSQLPELPHETVKDLDLVAALAERYARYGAAVRRAIDTASELGDLDTSDLFTEVSRDIDKHLWFLEAHLQG